MSGMAFDPTFAQSSSAPKTAQLPLIGLRMPETKAPDAFRTISEVAGNLDVPQHVLRFWESKFQQVKPLKRGGGRRYYRPEDVTLLASIKDLLYNQGFTIRGVQKLLKDGVRPALPRSSAAQVDSATTSAQTLAPASFVRGDSPLLSASARNEIKGLLDELKAMREFLRQNGI